MINYYIKIAFRNFIKYKTYFLISIGGLAIGMAVCFMLFLYVQNEFSYDRYNENADNIYRLCKPDAAHHSPQTAKILADGIPEIRDYARLLLNNNDIFQYEENKFKESSITFADPGIFRLFTFKFIYGGIETALTDPKSLVISEKIAKKYFGDTNPIGKVLKVNNKYDYTVTAVIEDMPGNSHFRYDIFITLIGTDEMFGNLVDNWGWQNFMIYFLMQDEFSSSDLENKFSDLIVRHAEISPEEPKPVYVLQNLKDIHLHSAHIEKDIQPQNSITYVMMFSVIGLLILLIACFNYINLFTANAAARIKEIGIKKVVGGTRYQLSRQFMGESYILLFISFLLSLFIVEISLPVFNDLLGKEILISDLLNPVSILGVTGIFFVTGLMAGSYPAIYLASLQPVKILKGSGNKGKSKSNFRKVLVIAQFAIVIVLLSCALLMFRQISFMRDKDLGFEKENILISEFEQFSNLEKFLSFKQALLENSSIVNVSAASRVPSGELNNYSHVLPHGQTKGLLIPYVHISYDYFETLGLRANQGRVFSKSFQTDIDEGVVLNEEAVRYMGIEGDPVGQTINCYWPRSARKIVGVVDDINFESLYTEIKPIVFVIYYDQCKELIIKIKSSEIEETKETINKVCKDFYPELLFEFNLMENNLEQIYKADKKTFQLMGYFTAIAMFIACIGLFGLASFILKSRTKEIGVHKIFGSSLFSIMTLLSRDYVKWLIIACVIAWPIAWISMKKWLEGFAYKIDINIWAFLFAGLFALVLALITVSWLSWNVARKNPVDALRYE